MTSIHYSNLKLRACGSMAGLSPSYDTAVHLHNTVLALEHFVLDKPAYVGRVVLQCC